MDPTSLKPPLINFGLTRDEASQLSQSVNFVLTKGSQEQFPGKRAIHTCSTLAFVGLFVATADSVYQEPHVWRTEGQELLHLCVTKNFGWLESIATHDLI